MSTKTKCSIYFFNHIPCAVICMENIGKYETSMYLVVEQLSLAFKFWVLVFNNGIETHIFLRMFYVRKIHRYNDNVFKISAKQQILKLQY